MTKKIKFTKMHWIWNDFIIINNSELLEKNIKLDKDLVQKMCDRNFGIWSDWIVIITEWKETKFKYHMYNPDGSEAEMCGNGIRCYMKYLIDEKLTSSTNVNVETGAGILNLDIDIFGFESMVDEKILYPKIQKAITKAQAIIFATSPGFIEQKKAKKIILNLLK